MTKTSTKSNKSLQDSHLRFARPAKFTAEADEFVLAGPEDLAKFRSKFKRGDEGNLPLPTESPLMFDIIYMGSRPLKMVFHHNKLILIDPQYITNEEYLVHPPSSFKSGALDSILPESVLQLFKTESGPDPVTPVRAGPRHVSLPSGDADVDEGSSSNEEEKDTNAAENEQIDTVEDES